MKKSLCVALILAGMVFVATPVLSSSMQIVSEPVMAETGDSSVSIDESSTSVSVDEGISDSEQSSMNNDEFIESLKTAYQNYLVPIFGSITLTSVLSSLITIIFAIFNMKNNSKNRKNIIDIFSMATNIIAASSALQHEIQASNIVAEETKKQFVETTRDLINKLAELTNKTKDLQKIKPILICLSELNVLIAQNSKEIVQSGIGEKLNDLVEMTRKLG